MKISFEDSILLFSLLSFKHLCVLYFSWTLSNLDFLSRTLSFGETSGGFFLFLSCFSDFFGGEILFSFLVSETLQEKIILFSLPLS